MDLGARINDRLGVAGISQSELARRVGVRQSTINGLIRGEQRSTTKLHQIARELGTTPAYLTGETDDPNSGSPDAPPLEPDAQELVQHFHMFHPADRRALLQIARSMAAGGAPPSDTVHAGGGVASAATVHDAGKDFRGEEG